MRCYRCKDDMVESVTNHFVDLKDCMVIIKGVPCLECAQCGERFYTDDVVAHIDEIIDAVRGVVAEIAVINYSDKVA